MKYDVMFKAHFGDVSMTMYYYFKEYNLLLSIIVLIFSFDWVLIIMHYIKFFVIDDKDIYWGRGNKKRKL